MRRVASFMVWVAYLTLGFSLLTIAPAAAYIDPAAGSLVFQVVVGAAMAVSLGVKVFWRRLSGFFTRRNR